MQLRFGFEGSTGAHACVRPSVCQVRRIVSEYDDSVATVAAFYDTDQDEAEEEDAADALVEAEEEHLEITLDLYDAYAHALVQCKCTHTCTHTRAHTRTHKLAHTHAQCHAHIHVMQCTCTRTCQHACISCFDVVFLCIEGLGLPDWQS